MCIEIKWSRNVGPTLLHRDERVLPRKEGAEVLARTVRRFWRIGRIN